MTARRMTALDNYLNNHARQYSPNNQNSRRNKDSPSTNDSGSWETNFFHSKRQCLDELNRILKKIDKQQARVRNYMKDYQISILDRLDNQYRALKAELCRILDGAYERCIIKVKQGFMGEEMSQLEKAVKMLESIRQKIKGFQFQLQTNYTYKKGISHVVMENFEVQRAEIIGGMNNALKNYEGKVFLRVEPAEFTKMKEAVANLFSYTGYRNGNPGSGRAQFNAPRMFSVPSNSVNITSVPFQPINLVNEGLVPEPHLNPPFKPFPSKISQNSPNQPSNIRQRNPNTALNANFYAPENSNLRGNNVPYAQNSEFEHIFNNQEPISNIRHPQPIQSDRMSEQQNKVRFSRPQSRQRSQSPNINSHRNRDLIRHSNSGNK